MNFDTKYLIRWGIPGWTLLIIVATMYTFNNLDQVLKSSENIDIISLAGLLLSAGFIGVPIGYLCHQFYFSVNWIFRFDVVITLFYFMKIRLLRKNATEDSINLIKEEYRHKVQDGFKPYNHSGYYHFEATWHEELIKLDADKRNYIAERYRHYLNTIHSLGALLSSLIIALLINLIFVLKVKEISNLGYASWTLLLLNCYLIVAVFAGFRYYSNNLIYFQAHMLNKIFDKTINNTK
ncbi:hypothetical protein [Halalkalibacter sp. APA_J-10(15)]|uniref:hypothetical protein n=1 Tax=Halalkalibacter sp. APA_J-10(15) TaxID=2933805 RepID=UPI001FF222C9|nr:hypothetical protein [Halalkalibacter sp. APA_J-10(15)]MCK0471406.1 hypothetical protein [Halalkalibacter sp. APA_J-10(15)]